ncbi:hypothetical protein VTK56DRAFT_9700 [Thermocarpiscus australiensis]
MQCRTHECEINQVKQTAVESHSHSRIRYEKWGSPLAYLLPLPTSLPKAAPLCDRSPTGNMSLSGTIETVRSLTRSLLSGGKMLDLGAILAGDQDRLLNSIWIGLLSLEALMVLGVAVRGLVGAVSSRVRTSRARLSPL